MPRHFRDFPIALKLNLVQAVVLLAIIIAATLATASHLRKQLESAAVQDLRQMNRLAVAMIAAYDLSLHNDIERSGRIFAGSFDKQLVLVEGGEKPRLVQHGTPISDSLDVVDAFTAKAGTVATIFVRQGNDFLRTATSLKKEDGSRASGTLLAADHPARQAILDGKPYTGKASLFGRDYMTYYVPAFDASGKVVGIFFVGLEFSEGLKALKRKLLAMKIGDTGYIFALDAGRQNGVFTVHPAQEGINVLTSKDSRGSQFMREMLDKKSGTLHYDWANPGETNSREKIAVFEHYPGWDWIVASSGYAEEISRAADSAVLSIVLMSLAIVVAALVSGYVATRIWVTRPLQEAMLEAERIAAGDLTGRLSAECADEVGRLKRAMGIMTGNLKTTIGEVRGAAGDMHEHALALVAAAEQVSQSSQVQSDSATGMAASVEELSVSIDQVVQHAHDAQRISGVSGQAASQGATVIQQAVAAMNQITACVREAAATVSELGRRSRDISAVVQVIREIADQTNLLALNAAIEAARAGEQGRGFAVVADEVRKLAERTAKSTRSIGDMISGIQDGASAAVDQMEQGVAQVEQGSHLADQTGRVIGEIDASTCEVVAAVGSITIAINEQSIASQTIAQGVEQIARMAEANHSAAQATTVSAQALRDRASRLDQALARFRVA